MNIGWIGTGVMGRSMAGHLLRAGHSLRIYNRTKEKAAELLAAGAAWCETPAAAAAGVDVLCTIVGRPADVEQVYFADNGVFKATAPPPLLIDFTTSKPSLARKIAAAAAAYGGESLDAPVSGGDVGARNGTLAIMVGGTREAFAQAQPLFSLLGGNVQLMGEAGAGQHTKMCNQILVAGNMIGVCESLLYAAAAGLDQSRVIDIIGKGAAGCWAISNMGPRIVAGNFAPGFYVEHFIKDMGIALSEAEAMNLKLPGLTLVHQLYRELAQQGHARSGTQALILALKKLQTANGLAR